MGVEGGAKLRGKPDPNVQLPAAVRAAAQRSEDLSKQAAEARANTPPEANAQVQVEVPPERPNPGVQTARFDPVNPQPPNEAPTAPPRPVGQALNQPQEPPNWEHQFKSTQGRLERSEQDNKRLAGQIGDMQRLLASINAAPPPQP